MRRLLLLIGVVALLFWLVRRAATVRVAGGKKGRDRLPGEPPKSLVCGTCGAEFEPAANGWTCPRCKR